MKVSLIPVKCITLHMLPKHKGLGQPLYQASSFGEANAILQNIARSIPKSTVGITIEWQDGCKHEMAEKLLDLAVSVPNLRNIVTAYALQNNLHDDGFFEKYDVQ